MHPGTSLSGTWQIPAFAYIEDYRIGGSWIRSSPQLESWWGYTVEESGTPNFWKTCLHPGDRDRVLAEDERCERTLEPWRSTHRMLTRDGRTLWVRDEAVLVYDDAGEPRYWQGLSLDITDRTMAQLEATRRLGALDELKNSVLTAVSHELRTPLPPSWAPPSPWSVPAVGCRRRRPLTCSAGSAPAPVSSTGY